MSMSMTSARAWFSFFHRYGL